MINEMDKRTKSASDSVWRDFDIMSFPVTGNALLYKDEFMLIDNIGFLQDKEVKSRYVAVGYPYKITFTCIMFCVQGTMTTYLNLEKFEMKAGDVVVGLPGNIGETKEMSEDCQVAIIAYAGDKYSTEADRTIYMMFQKYFSKKKIIHPSKEDFDESIHIYQLMRKKLQQPGFRFVREALNGYMQVLGSFGYQWICDFYDNSQSNQKESRSQQQFDTFIDLVQQNFTQQRDISFYADKMCITPKYLSTIVHNYSGRYAGEWIKDYVILEAKALLKSKRYSVQQVCDELNFSNASFFGKYFKQAVGVSPGKYILE